MRKSQLKSGMGFERKDGSRARIIDVSGQLMYVRDDEYRTFGHIEDMYLEDLTYKTTGSTKSNASIVKVFRRPSFNDLLNPSKHGGLLWERKA